MLRRASFMPAGANQGGASATAAGRRPTGWQHTSVKLRVELRQRRVAAALRLLDRCLERGMRRVEPRKGRPARRTRVHGLLLRSSFEQHWTACKGRGRSMRERRTKRSDVPPRACLPAPPPACAPPAAQTPRAPRLPQRPRTCPAQQGRARRVEGLTTVKHYSCTEGLRRAGLSTRLP